jgi:hypothetical protein
MWTAWQRSGVSIDKRRLDSLERGGWIIERTNLVTRLLLGRYYVERWTPRDRADMWVRAPADGAVIVGSFHTHPNAWADLQSASPGDWQHFGNQAVPHYILSAGGIFRLLGSEQQFIGPVQDLRPESSGCGIVPSTPAR